MIEGLVIFTICWLNITNQQQTYSNPLIWQPTNYPFEKRTISNPFKVEIVVLTLRTIASRKMATTTSALSRKQPTNDDVIRWLNDGGKMIIKWWWKDVGKSTLHTTLGLGPNV